MSALIGLGDYLAARPGELSGGQQQRVALARTLVLQPCILLMDKPLSSQDGELKFTLVYVTHDPEEAEELGMRVVHLRDGRSVG